MPGLLGEKKGMTQIWGKDRRIIPVTVVEAGPCPIVQKKTVNADGYNAIQIGFGKKKGVNGPLMGHFSKAGLEVACKYLREIRLDKVEGLEVGQMIKADIFKEGDVVDVSGVSIGKGFAGTIKRWHFARGPMSHGSKSHRLPGSSGGGTDPGRVLKGTRRAGRLGGKKVTARKVKVVKVDAQSNLLLIKGTVPGSVGSMVLIRKR